MGIRERILELQSVGEAGEAAKEDFRIGPGHHETADTGQTRTLRVATALVAEPAALVDDGGVTTHAGGLDIGPIETVRVAPMRLVPLKTPLVASGGVAPATTWN